ncbi:hypothetical protein [uncultured Cohaesibacter sp.]|uniref:hypothetical protein n=1 Tax=uncultured Cohaesibacter sp. TaxID=1002546 RepID=UPI0029C88E2D|nr:hypothetical protein [uncultured Cohaesibacter sp.]
MQTFSEVTHHVSDNVTKLVFRNDTAVAEAVLYRYPTYEERTVICCSTMSGCPVGCRFCGAGDYFARALTGEEIYEQVVECIRHADVDPDEIEKFQIMFMSMGEPMLNRRGLEGAILMLAAMYPNAQLLISTMGPDVDYEWLTYLSCDIPQIGLQFSIHETDPMRRDGLIPFRSKLTLEGISRVGMFWAEMTGRKPFFNYCAADHNTEFPNALALEKLFPPKYWEATISVICERNDGMPARNEHQQKLAKDFSAMLLERGFNVRVFDPAGQDDIGGGCGQLWFVQKWMKDNPELARPSIGNGRPVVHAPQAQIALL